MMDGLPGDAEGDARWETGVHHCRDCGRLIDAEGVCPVCVGVA